MRWQLAWGAVAVALASACGEPPAEAPSAWRAVGELRATASASDDGETIGRWALSELLAPGGTAEQADRARRRLETVPRHGLWANLASGVVDDSHGHPRTAAASFARTLGAAATSADPLAPLAAWFAARRLIALRASVANLYETYRGAIDDLLSRPGHLGWRAVAELQEWRSAEVYDRVASTGADYDADVLRRSGCLRGIRLAGPFGHGAGPDRRRSFPAERPGPWPAAWAPDALRNNVPRVLSVTQRRCLAVADEQVQPGVFYAETYFETSGERELLVAVQGAVAVWIDDSLVLSRGGEEWGSWQRFGAHVDVGPGRHRVLARLLSPAASVRLLNPDGTAAGLASDGDPRRPYSLDPPRILSDPNPIEPLVAAAVRGAPIETSAIQAALGADAAHGEALDDVASAFIEPWVAPTDAAPLALFLASSYAAGDPALPEDARASRARALRDRALARDPDLWRARLAAILDDAETHGLAQGVDPLRKLAADVKDEPEILEQLARLYGRLGWRADQSATLASLAERFPDDVSALRAYLEVLDQDGPAALADQVAARVRKLDPDTEVDLDRALARRDYQGAVHELEALQKRHPERKEIAGRIAEILTRSGDLNAGAAELERALAKQPLDEHARFRLADHAFAAGDSSALRRALASALQAGAPSDDLRAAIDVVEESTDLEPYRKDGREVIRAFEAWERAGHHMEGTAARVLDYGAIWVHDDGSSEMLEHEIQRIQSQEAINSESEIEPPAGLVLHLRVLKPDGRVFEPEPVAGKPTLTLPNLEVGDYVEMEHVTSQPGDGAKGRQFSSPHWFFREADKGYWTSEFVVVTPADRQVEVETRGNVPPATVKNLGAFVERRWRVELSPPAIVEPDSPPITEFLPSVRLGWGISLDATLARLVDLAVDETPLDPRLRVKALDIVRGVPESAVDERARRLYRYVVDHIQESKEGDGRRVVTGGSGVRQSAFRYLLRLVGIDSQLALVKNRLATPPLGKMSEVEEYDALVLRFATEHGVRWMTVHDKFAPYGYVPAELRDQPAIVLAANMPRDVVRAQGVLDSVQYDGRADVRPDGSASLKLTLTFRGNRAIAWRNVLDRVPQAKLYDFVEREIVAPSFDGGHVREMKVDAADQVDQPLVMHLDLEVPQLGKLTGGRLSLRPPFAPHLEQLAALPERHTPLLRNSSAHTEVRLQVVLPDTMSMPADLARGEVRFRESSVVARDSVHGHALDFDRVIDLPAGRVDAGEGYAKWAQFVRDADVLLTHDVLVGVR